MVVSHSVIVPRGKAVSGLAMTNGARVMLSVPPPMKTSPAPVWIDWAQRLMASRPEPQRRLTVRPPTVTGRPASNTAMRATLRLSSPAPLAQPRITSSTRAGSSALRSTSVLITRAARSSGRTSLSAPP